MVKKRYEIKKRQIEWKEMKEWIDNEIGDEGAKALSESLKINTSLTSLGLGSDERIRNEKEERDNESMFRQQNQWKNQRTVGNKMITTLFPSLSHFSLFLLEKHGNMHERIHCNTLT